MELVLEFPEVGVEVYRRRGGADRSVAEVKEALEQAPDTRFAGNVLVDPAGEPVLYTENLFVKFRDDRPGEDCRRALLEAGLRIKDELPYATNAFFAAAPEGSGQEVFAIAQRLLERDDVEDPHPGLVPQLGRRAVFPEQWPLATTSIAGQSVSASANVAAAHALTQGEEITVAIIDTGFDVDHEEFASAGKVVAPHDASSGDAAPRPLPGGNHASAGAGVACADGVAGATGVAPRARLMPIRMVSQLGSQQEANAFFWAASHGADVISCRWGP